MPSGSPKTPSDFNNDNITDIVWRNYATGANELWYMAGDRLQQSASLPAQLDLGWQIEGNGDFNGDGHNDLIWRHEASGQNSIWLMQGNVVLQELQSLSISGSRWKIDGVGDFNADGKDDVLWRNYSTGANLLWHMDGALPITTDRLETISDTSWHIDGVGDFDGDGWEDLLWLNDDTGQAAVWHMQGATKQSVIDLGVMRGTDWRVQGVGDFNGDGSADILWRQYQPLASQSGQTQGKLEVSFLREGSVLENRAIEITPTNAAAPASTVQLDDLSWQASTTGTAERPERLRLDWNHQTVTQGSVYDVAWNPSPRTEGSVASPRVDIALYKDGELEQYLARSIEDSGSYRWRVPTTLTEASGYRLRISQSSDSLVEDFSDLPFAVESPQLTETKPDLDIQLFDPSASFSERQWQAMRVAEANWERLITQDKDESGTARVWVTHGDNQLDGSDWETSLGPILAQAVLDDAHEQRTNFDSIVDASGVDYDNRVHWNPTTMADMGDRELIVIMMHELGHALGLDHEWYNPNSVMYNFPTTENPQISINMLYWLETQGYGVDHSAVDQMQWTV